VPEVLSNYRPRFQLAVISNFDGAIATHSSTPRDLGIFQPGFISSELGADKPDPEIFPARIKANASECERGFSMSATTQDVIGKHEGGGC